MRRLELHPRHLVRFEEGQVFDAEVSALDHIPLRDEILHHVPEVAQLAAGFAFRVLRLNALQRDAIQLTVGEVDVQRCLQASVGRPKCLSHSVIFRTFVKGIENSLHHKRKNCFFGCLSRNMLQKYMEIFRYFYKKQDIKMNI